jgi:hypothetical protein
VKYNVNGTTKSAVNDYRVAVLFNPSRGLNGAGGGARRYPNGHFVMSAEDDV